MGHVLLPQYACECQPGLLSRLCTALAGAWGGKGCAAKRPRAEDLAVPAAGPLAWVLMATTGLLVPSLYYAYKRRRKATYEYGPLDITSMTPAAAKALHGVPATGQGAKPSRPRPRRPQHRDSLIPDALLDLEESAGLAQDSLAPQEEVDYHKRTLAAVGAPPFRQLLKEKGLAAGFKRARCQVLQLNIGLYCNQACTHCHVESSPLRKEHMSDRTVDRCLHLLRTSPHVNILDITGGAPELNPGFRRIVEGAAALRDSGARPDLRIIDRCNLTVLLEPGQEGLADFLVQHRVDVIASLPSYDAAQTDRQRGRKVFEHSVEALRLLNDHGYGAGDHGGLSQAGRGLRLDLVFNPPGPFLPPRQDLLEAKYKTELSAAHGVQFDHLIAIANMPIKRYFDFLRKKQTLEGYMDLLVRNFNGDTVPELMCLNTVNVSWDGRLYDCDFNQQLELGLGRKGLTVFDIETLDDGVLRESAIATGAHCFGCTAAQGSS